MTKVFISIINRFLFLGTRAMTKVFISIIITVKVYNFGPHGNLGPFFSELPTTSKRVLQKEMKGTKVVEKR
jgi:hypothetical protein